ncbi:MAG: GxxExxY protein [Rhodospirillales bacterium]|nr:GxxExxY protein [Rhodospirillales bacterium]
MDSHTSLDFREDKAAKNVIDAAMVVHKELGPGLLESIYEECLCRILSKNNIPFQRQVSFPVSFMGEVTDQSLRLDLVVDNCLIVELKSVEKIIPLHEAQLLTYLKMSDKRLGLLMNFNSTLLKDGLKRIVRRE